MNTKKLAFTLENMEFKFKFTSDHDYKLPCFMDHHGSSHNWKMNVKQKQTFNKNKFIMAYEII